jgi:branched-chain amino acid aminotransferase
MSLKFQTDRRSLHFSFMENFVTFLHKNNLADIQEHEIIAFESQKAEEILMISDEGIFSVGKIRNKTFETSRFLNW